MHMHICCSVYVRPVESQAQCTPSHRHCTGACLSKTAAMSAHDLSFLFSDLDLDDDYVLQRLDLTTNEITLLSHTHGRDRRDERGIQKRELQAAVKYGVKERAGSGRNNEKRWKFTYNGVVYITDETTRHEITSWRLEERSDERSVYMRNEIDVAGDAATSHIIFVVDHSGSMKKRDIGHAKTCPCNTSRNMTCALCKEIPTRTAAVYDSIVEQFLIPQLRLQQQQQCGTALLSLIEMSLESKVTIRRAPLDDGLVLRMRAKRNSQAKSHGNYLNALDKVVELLEEDREGGKQLIIVFLSDGAPSDHTSMPCEHGTLVWQDAPGGQRSNKHGRSALTPCPQDSRKQPRCRKAVHDAVLPACIEKIGRIRSAFGSDRVELTTVAFGPDTEDYTVLEAMALAVPGRGTYSKLGLSPSMLSTTFSSLSSSLTSLRTVGAAKRDLRGDVGREDALRAQSEMSRHSQMAGRGEDVPVEASRNHMFFGARGGSTAVFKSVWRREGELFQFVEERLEGRGIAYRRDCFSEGVERFCFRGSEFVPRGAPPGGWVCDGPPLVVKEARHIGNLLDASFHDDMSKVQQMSRVAADSFNSVLSRKVQEWRQARRVLGAGNTGHSVVSHCTVNFLETCVYRVAGGEGDGRRILAERFLEGRYTKWNNNFGKVLPRPARCSLPVARPALRGGRRQLCSIIEESEGEDEGGGGWAMPPPPGPTKQEEEEEFLPMYDVPQCFSHFTFTLNFSPRALICDLQGTWNRVDGFQFTDPAIHSLHSTQEEAYGQTDKGCRGIEEFFRSHKCSRLCELMGLRSPQQQLEQLEALRQRLPQR